MNNEKKPFHEGKACDAVLRIIEERQGSNRQKLTFPEKTGGPPVELTCIIGERHYAVEHTGIEPFEGQVRWTREGESKVAPIIDGLRGRLPPDDDFEILLPITELIALRGSQLTAAQGDIIDWVGSVGPTLSSVEAYGRQIPTRAPKLPNVPCDLSLRRWKPPPHFKRGVYISPTIGDDLETLRIDRIVRAYDKKIGKLMEWKRSGARTILVLENTEISVTNAQVVADALSSIEKFRTEKPDEVYLFDTCCRAPWWVWALRIDDKGYYSLSQERKCLTEIDPTTLVNLTGN